MTTVVNVHAAKTQLSRLIEKAAAGEEVVIAKAGVPIARLVPLQGPQPKRQLGLLAGAGSVPDDFDRPLPDEAIADFEGP